MRTRPAPGLLVGMAALAVLAGGARAVPPGAERGPAQPESEVAQALQSAGRSVVRVTTIVELQKATAELDAQQAICRNTGFFVGSDGEVLTSLLALVGSSNITVADAMGRRSSAHVVALDQASGLALLRTDLKDTVPLELVHEPLEAGRWILLASVHQRDGGTEVSVAPGLVAPHRRTIRLRGIDWEGLTVASVPVRAGCAAAPLLDTQGRLRAVVMCVLRGPAGHMGPEECLALPAADLAPIVANLRQGKSRRLGWLGVGLAQEPGQEGVRVTAVLNGSPGQKAQVKAGDLLLQIDGRDVTSPDVVARHIAQAKPGTTIQLGIRRGGESITIPATVGPRPLLITGGLRRPGEDIVRVRWRRSLRTPSTPGAPPTAGEVFDELMEENQALRDRLAAMERHIRDQQPETD